MARMTIVFESMDDMIVAKAMIILTKSSSKVKTPSICDERSLYGTSQGDNAKFNCGATDAGYKDALSSS
ncbi:hypothetical protein O9993_06830 [Vibrio lentus]|nr:hypothetical protein [Vibrio lentus]